MGRRPARMRLALSLRPSTLPGTLGSTLFACSARCHAVLQATIAVPPSLLDPHCMCDAATPRPASMCVARVPSCVPQYGGAIRNTGGNLTIENSTLDRNSAYEVQPRRHKAVANPSPLPCLHPLTPHCMCDAAPPRPARMRRALAALRIAARRGHPQESRHPHHPALHPQRQLG